MRTSDVHNTGSEALTSSENEDIAYCMWPVRLARLQRWVSRLMGEIHSQRDIGVIKEETFDNIYSALLESHMTGLMYEMQPEHCDDPQNRAFIVDVEQEVDDTV